MFSVPNLWLTGNCVYGVIKWRKSTRKGSKPFNFKIFISKGSIGNITSLLGYKIPTSLCVSFEDKLGSCPKAELLLLYCPPPCLCIPSLTWSGNGWTSPWNSGKAMDATWDPFPKNKKWAERFLCPVFPQGPVLWLRAELD